MFAYLLHMKQDPLEVTTGRVWQVQNELRRNRSLARLCATATSYGSKDRFAGRKCADPKEPRPGDAVFVRYRRQGRGIGVVLENQGGDGADRTKLQVLWLNKTPRTAPGVELFSGGHPSFD